MGHFISQIPVFSQKNFANWDSPFILPHCITVNQGKSMKKVKADALIRKLVTNTISREEFGEFLDGLEDDQMVIFLEMSLRSHFDSIMEDHESKVEYPRNISKSD